MSQLQAVKSYIERRIDEICDTDGFVMNGDLAQYDTLRSVSDFIESLEQEQEQCVTKHTALGVIKLIWHHNAWPWGMTTRVITSDGGAIVEMSFEDINPGVCYLSGLSVIPPKRRSGIAKHLMFACESYCRENEIFRIDLNSVLTDWVQEFYKKCGYTPIKEENGFMQMYKILER